MTEIALEPIRLLPERSMLASVSLRTLSSGRKFTITIAKRFLEDSGSPRYVWSIDEIEPSGDSLDGGAAAGLPMDKAFEDPETAYWSAVDKLCEITRG